MTSAHVEAGHLPVETLCSAIVLYSDNGAANLLLARVGGPAALTAYVRGLGDRVTPFDRTKLAAKDRSVDGAAGEGAVEVDHVQARV